MDFTIALLTSCVLANITGPPAIEIDTLNFQLLPVDKRACPGIDPEKDIIFEFHSSKYSREIIRIGDDKPYNLNFSRPTVIFFPGFMESSTSKDSQDIKDAYVDRNDCNVIIINMRRLFAGPFYIVSTRNVLPASKYIAEFITYLTTLGLNLINLHLIGMSLGGQTAGITASLIQTGKVGRITGLDPAGPLFLQAPPNLRLDKSDAEFVDVIHTNAGLFGYPKECGHVDFWPNGGTGTQPGCQSTEITKRNFGSISEQVFCSHWRSYQLYVETIRNQTAFLAKKCNSRVNFIEGNCDLNEEVYMGLNVPKSANGNYYLRTGFPYY